jgi:RNA recognition motif-containing protein
MEIFIRSLPFKFKEADLKNLFEVFGEVTTTSIVMDKMTRQSKGFGFVTMSNDEAALIAIEALNGEELQGRKIEVSISVKKDKVVEKPTERPKAKPFKINADGNMVGGFRGIGKGYDKRNRK